MHFETTVNIVLAAWERAYGLGPVERGLALLSLARPHDSAASLIRMTIGQRDSELLGLRQRLFGNDISSLDACPSCNEKIEVSFTVSDVCLSTESVATVPCETPGMQSVDIDGRSLTIRPATSADLIAMQQAPTSRSRREALMRRCVTVSGPGSDDQAVTDEMPLELSDSGVRTISDTFAGIDPQADIRIAMDCTRCDHKWSSRFDIVSFLWTEIDTWAQRLLAEVHSLAFAYGWSEHDILNMSPWRRHLYLGMLRR